MANQPHRAHAYRAPPAGYIPHLRPDIGGGTVQREAASRRNESCRGHDSPYALLDDIWHGGESSIDEVEDAASAWEQRERTYPLRRPPTRAETINQDFPWSRREASEAQSANDQGTVEAILRKCQRAQANLKLIQPRMHAPAPAGEMKNLSQGQLSGEVLQCSEKPWHSSAFDESHVNVTGSGPSSESERFHGDFFTSGSHLPCCRQQRSKEGFEESDNSFSQPRRGDPEVFHNHFEDHPANNSAETNAAAGKTVTSRIQVHRRTSHLVTQTRGSLSNPCCCRVCISSGPKEVEKAATDRYASTADGSDHHAPPKFLDLKSRLPTVRLVRPGLAGMWGAKPDRLDRGHPAAKSQRVARTAASSLEPEKKASKGKRLQRSGRRGASGSSLAEKDAKNPLVQALAIFFSLTVQTAKFASPVWSVLVRAFAAFAASISQDIRVNNPIDLVCWVALCLFCLCLASCVLKALGILLKQCWAFVMAMFLPVRLLRRLLF